MGLKLHHDPPKGRLARAHASRRAAGCYADFTKMDSSSDITGLLAAAEAGDPAASSELFEAVYAKLHQLAKRERRKWSGHHTLDTTALIHEAYLKLAKSAGYSGKAHFFGTAAKAMRHVLVNYARARMAQRRGGGAEHVDADTVSLPAGAPIEELLAMDEALNRLEQENPRACRVVECRFFAGLDIAATAQTLGISTASVKRDWRLGAAQLYASLQPSGD